MVQRGLGDRWVMANDSDVARVAAAVNAPGFRYRSFGNEAVRVAPPQPEAPPAPPAKRQIERFASLPEPMPAPDEMLSQYDNSLEPYPPVLDSYSSLGPSDTITISAPQRPEMVLALPAEPSLLAAPMAEPMPASISPSMVANPPPVMAPMPAAEPTPQASILVEPMPMAPPGPPLFSWPESLAAVTEPTLRVEPALPISAAPPAPAPAPPPVFNPVAEPIALRASPAGGFRLLESIGHRNHEEVAPRNPSAGGTLGMLRQAVESRNTGAAIAPALEGMTNPAEIVPPGGQGAAPIGGLLPAAAVTVPLSDVMRLIAAGATPPPSPFDAFRVALGAQPGR